MTTPPRLQLTGMTKRYPTVVANDAVSLRVQPGEIHAVLGENGAGKSTLMKLIYGVTQPDSGEIALDGKRVRVANPKAARAMGISMVFQHFSLFDTLTVAQNVWLGLDAGLKLDAVRAQVQQKAAEYGLPIDPDRPVHTLSVGERQRVEIIRALLGEPRVLILDEPTSVLTPQAVESLFTTLRQLSQQGCSILYISHKLHEIRALCHGCTVLRGGKVTGRCDPREESDASLSRMMIGAEPPTLKHAAKDAGEVALRLVGLNLPKTDVFGTALKGIALDLRAGEVLGVAGVSGNGQQELLRAISGEDLGAPEGSIQLFGQDVSQVGPTLRRSLGLRFVPEERLGRGAVPTQSLAHNAMLTSQRGQEAAISPLGWLRLRAMREKSQGLIDRFGVKAGGPQALASSLSGGNLQKFIVGREIAAAPKVLVISQPTWGVDVGAAAQIHSELLWLRDAGCAVLVFSEEIDELYELSDRLCVIAQGRLSPVLPTAQLGIAKLGAWMGGAFESEAEVAHAAA